MTGATTIRSLLELAVRRLDPESARLDAEVLLAACLGKSRSYLHAWPEHDVDAATQDRFAAWIARRAGGEPVAYLTGMREFWSLPLAVTPDVLIPRPETETLVALALEKMPAHRALQIADLGTGSGAIALAIASERPACAVLAADTSAAALKVARGNAKRLGVANIRFVAGAWCAPLGGNRFDFILCNPPYVAAADPHLEAGDVRFEPRAALVAGPAGMDELARIIPCAYRNLCEGGWLLVEHGYDQGGKVTKLFAAEGYRDISDHTDDAGLSRVTLGRR